ncbi:unnamed protein product, partial [Durusdinium trenchii]
MIPDRRMIFELEQVPVHGWEKRESGKAGKRVAAARARSKPGTRRANGCVNCRGRAQELMTPEKMVAWKDGQGNLKEADIDVVRHNLREIVKVVPDLHKYRYLTKKTGGGPSKAMKAVLSWLKNNKGAAVDSLKQQLRTGTDDCCKEFEKAFVFLEHFAVGGRACLEEKGRNSTVKKLHEALRVTQKKSTSKKRKVGNFEIFVVASLTQTSAMLRLKKEVTTSTGGEIFEIRCRSTLLLRNTSAACIQRAARAFLARVRRCRDAQNHDWEEFSREVRERSQVEPLFGSDDRALQLDPVKVGFGVFHNQLLINAEAADELRDAMAHFSDSEINLPGFSFSTSDCGSEGGKSFGSDGAFSNRSSGFEDSCSETRMFPAFHALRMAVVTSWIFQRRLAREHLAGVPEEEIHGRSTDEKSFAGTMARSSPVVPFGSNPARFSRMERLFLLLTLFVHISVWVLLAPPGQERDNTLHKLTDEADRSVHPGPVNFGERFVQRDKSDFGMLVPEETKLSTGQRLNFFGFERVNLVVSYVDEVAWHAPRFLMPVKGKFSSASKGCDSIAVVYFDRPLVTPQSWLTLLRGLKVRQFKVGRLFRMNRGYTFVLHRASSRICTMVPNAFKNQRAAGAFPAQSWCHEQCERGLSAAAEKTTYG